MRVFVLIALCVFPCRGYDLTGRVEPRGTFAVFLHGATTPFQTSTQTDASGRFQFRKLAAGDYTLIVSTAARGELRRTVDVSASTVDSKGRLDIDIHIDSVALEKERRGAEGATVSATSLAVPGRAVSEFESAQRCLSRRNAACASAHLVRATQIAPRFAAAWNQLGTIAYQTGKYSDAEMNFRQALNADPEAFQPLVNLGGVLLNLGRPAEAVEYNRQAVARRPGDALANSQLGLTYLQLDHLEEAEKFLKVAIQLDPAHFSHPQLALAQVYARRGNRDAAVGALKDFLAQHPDDTEATRVRQEINRLK